MRLISAGSQVRILSGPASLALLAESTLGESYCAAYYFQSGSLTSAYSKILKVAPRFDMIARREVQFIYGQLMNALVSIGDEGRSKLRKAMVSCKQAIAMDLRMG